ncbi:MAG: XRE family transcriptional regulator [Planctomycetia bacterium]|nr:XRE family transcriptional regulator [Planctomycetia bacterium]
MKPGTPGFVGTRLRESREARSLSAIALADLIGVTRAAVSQYEREHQSPSPEVMRKISDCLNVPVQFFLRQPWPGQSGTVFYRCMSVATKRARLRAQRRYEWLREIVAFLRNYVRFPEVEFPAFDLPDDPAQIDNDRIEELATEARSAWRLGPGPISNVTWLLENHGAVVTRCELGAATLDAFSEWNPNDSTPYVILGSGKGSAARSRYDAVHELGHTVMHRHVRKSLLQQADSFNFIEAQAHRFAGAFLLPARTFAEDAHLPSLDGFRALKEKWHVSIAAMIKRAVQLDLISEGQERRLWINLGRRKWRTKEPLDNVLEPEQPRFLRRAMELLITKGIVAPNELPLRLALATHDIEELTGLDPGYLGGAEPDIELVGSKSERKEEAQIIRFPNMK